jgi:hypothetical protein
VPSGLSVNRKPLRLTRENRPTSVVIFLITDNSDLVPLLVMRARWLKSELAARFRLFMRLDVEIGKQHILALLTVEPQSGDLFNVGPSNVGTHVVEFWLLQHTLGLRDDVFVSRDASA